MFYWIIQWIRELMKDGCSGDCRQGRLPCNCKKAKR